MRQQDQVAYLERMLGMVKTNTRDDGPGLSHTRVEGYFDPAQYRREVDVLFRRHPIVVGHSAQVAKPGDFVTHDATGQPILIVRGSDGVLRAFLNVCRHRSATVEPKPCGAGKRAFVCPYHGWSYDLTGRLLGITDGSAFGDVDKSQHALRPLKLAEKYGLIWVVPTALADGENAGLDIDAYLGAVQPDLEGWTMEGWQRHSFEPIVKNMNWKLVIDTFLELYHFRYLHPSTVFPLFLDNIATYEQMGRHIRIAAAKRTLTEIESQPKADWRILDHAIVLYSIFPNTVLTYTQDHCGIFTSFPISPEEAVLHFSVLISPEEKARKPESYWEANRNLFASALVEDLGIGETIQRNCHTGANRQQTFGKFEKALGWYHAEVDRAIA
ncbi:MAG: Rieske 2Fe-2S domain-containing protein [Alphaproteobacteria bacterium]|nr:MAG: Rieske 2Fe-2S domain-containing protein [Alphaproteobacteria bacterium]